MTRPSDAEALRDSVRRHTAVRPAYWGYWLAEHRAHTRLSPAGQARSLSLTDQQLASLALCLAPRRGSEPEDIAVVATHCGMPADVLAGLWSVIRGAGA